MAENHKQLSLVMICDEINQKVLLGMKKRGFGCGRWNGFGGKQQTDETIDECAKRETEEECGLSLQEYFKIGHIVFEFNGDPVLLDVHIFRCDVYTGTVVETEEMRPEWFSYDEVPFDQMWPDDYLWYPYLFKNQKFKGYFLFEGHDKMLKEELHAVDSVS